MIRRRPANVVILGCGRSGTSILGELFEALPDYHYLFEPSLAKLREADPGGRPLAAKVPKDDRARAQRFDPGLPFALDDLHAAVPTPRLLVWNVRHPLDAICSLRPGIDAGWSHNPRPPDFEDWLGRPLVARCARHWAWINGPGYDAVAHEAVLVRYEDVVAAPADVARRLLRRARVRARGSAALSDWARRVSNRKGEDSYEAKHQVRWSRLDHRARVGRWRENLDDDDLALVRPILGDVPARFGYRMPWDDVGGPGRRQARTGRRRATRQD